MHNNSGYHDCPCRDCFEIAIGCDDEGKPDLCSECEEHGCDATGNSECETPPSDVESDDGSAEYWAGSERDYDPDEDRTP